MLKLLQATVFLGIWFSNIAYHWTPNMVAAGILALMATMLVTGIIMEIRSRFAAFRQSRRELTPPSAD